MDTSQKNPCRVVRTRNRIPRSCANCRHRKLKCNREKPACHNCIARNQESSCAYEGAAGANSQSPNHVPQDSTSGPTMRGRIDRLESLILNIVSETQGSQNQKSSSSTPDSGHSEVITSNVHDTALTRIEPANVNGNGSTFDDSEVPRKVMEITSIHSQNSHWDTILQDIAIIKDIWIQDYEAQDAIRKVEPPVKKHRPGIFTGITPAPSMAEILSSLPAKSVADKLIARLYDAYSPSVPTKLVFHRQTFLKQYQRHCDDPAKTSPGWLGLLFALLSFTMQSYGNSGHEPEPSEFRGKSQELSDLYRIRAIQCIRIADGLSNRSVEHVIEALIFYNQADLWKHQDTKLGIWLMSGIILRLALQQELHRDPSHDPSIPPFKCEMRRRLWATIWIMDLLFSHQTGTPRMIRHTDSDTLPPRNLHEEELYEEMTVLPPSRPLTEPTQMSFFVSKINLIRIFGEICENLHSLEVKPYSHILQLDKRLREVNEEIAPHLKMRPITQMIGEPPSLIMERFILHTLFNKALCILHRNYLSASHTNPSLIYSRITCVTSSTKLLSNQATLHQESRPGGLLSTMKWYQYSLSTHDYLMAAMILCVDIFQELKYKTGDEEEMKEHIQALELTRRIWEDVLDDEWNARKEVAVLTQILLKIKRVRFGEMRELVNGDDIGISNPVITPPVPMQIDDVEIFTSTQIQTDPDISLDSNTFPDGFTWPVGFDTSCSGVELDWAAWDLFVYNNGTNYEAQTWNGDMGVSPFI